MDIRVIAVGKIKEKYLQQGINKYLKELRRFCTVEIIELADERAPDNLSLAQEKMIKAREGQRIRNAIRGNSFVVALAIEGQALSSQDLARRLKGLEMDCKAKVDFIIGGSLGLDDEILKRANLLLSFSELTFPHQLMRLILLEQLHNIVSSRQYLVD